MVKILPANWDGSTGLEVLRDASSRSGSHEPSDLRNIIGTSKMKMASATSA